MLPHLNSDLVFLAMMLLFSISNGLVPSPLPPLELTGDRFVATCVFLAGVVEPTLEPHEVDLGATSLAFFLTSGLCVGSLLSFFMRAIL